MAYTLADVAEESKSKQFQGKKSYTIKDVSQNNGIRGKAWDALAVPEQKSREGLKMMADAIPESYTGNTLRDVAVNTPKVLAESVAEVAPSFISRESMLAGAAGKVLPKLATPAKWTAKQLEAASGLSYKTPGAIAESFTNPSLPYKPGIESAREAYQTSKGASPIREELTKIMSKKDFVEKALEAAKSGNITPEEALEARKALDGVRKEISDVGYRKAREILDTVAKTKFADADKGYQEAVKAENIRRFFPINKTGSPSIVKGALLKVATPLFPLVSPAVQGFTASAMGAALNPIMKAPQLGMGLAGTLGNYIKRRKDKK